MYIFVFIPDSKEESQHTYEGFLSFLTKQKANIQGCFSLKMSKNKRIQAIQADELLF